LLSLGCQKKADVPQHVFLIVIDTLRADHLGCYGYKVPTSPTIDGLASEGILFKNAYATASNTLESTFSFFQATTALTNKVHTLLPEHTLSLSVTSLQKYLQQAGYNTLAVVSNPWLKWHEAYFRDGFTHFKFVRSEKWGVLNTTDLVTHAVSDFLESKLDRNGKNFFYIHYLDPHDPYRPPVDYNFFTGKPPQNPPPIYVISREAGVKSKLKQDPDYSGMPVPAPLSDNDLNYYISKYDGEIRHVDFHLGKLLHTLESMKILDDSLIIITSDHGEEFLEHGLLRHGFQLYDETIRVPLIFYWKNHLDSQVKDVIASGIDIAPTIMNLCGLDAPSSMLGSSLLRKKNYQPILFCTHYINQNQRGMRMGKWKLIENVATGEMKVFDMEHDPGERQNLFNDALKEREIILKSYKQLLAKHAVKTGDKEVMRPAQPSEMDEETREQLQGLGYL
jgi:arylsulfatase A-like enzyme